MVCTFISRILGFVRSVVIAAIFGASAQADVLNAVFNIPNNFRKLLAEGALSSAFIPVLAGCLVEKSSGHSAKKLVQNIFSLQILILIPLLILSILFARPLMNLFLDFPEAEKMALSASLFKWLCHYLLLVSLSALLMGVLNAHGIFVIPALTPVLFSLSVITSLLLFHRFLGVFSMAVGVLTGGLFQILFQLPRFLKEGYRLKPDLNFRNQNFKRVLRLWIPVVATSSIFAINQQIAIRFASGLEEGSTSALSYALVVWQLPFGVFSASVSTVLFPRLSRQAAANDKSGVIDSISYGLRFLFLLLVPTTLFYTIMGPHIIAAVYQRGAFTVADARLTALVLSGYSLGLFSVGAFSLLQRFFYAHREYRTPFFVALLVTTVDILLSLWLKETRLRVTGLAVANSAAFSLGFCLLFWAARRKLGRLGGRKIMFSFLRVTGALVPGVSVLVLFSHLAGRCSPGWWTSLVTAVLAGVIFLLITCILYYLFGVEIIRQLLKAREKR